MKMCAHLEIEFFDLTRVMFVNLVQGW